MPQLMRIPTKRFRLFREKHTDVEKSAETYAYHYELGPLRATYSVRLPVWLATRLALREERRIIRALEAADAAIYEERKRQQAAQ